MEILKQLAIATPIAALSLALPYLVVKLMDLFKLRG